MKKIIFFCILIGHNFLFGQSVNSKAKYLAQIRNPTKSFIDIKEIGNTYFDSLKIANGGIITSAEKAFKRWEYYWEDRMSYPGCPNGGDFSKVDIYSKLLATNSINICTSSLGNSSWHQLGPFSMPTSTMGIVTCVAMNKEDHIIYAGTNFSGLWRSFNDGDNWENVTDILGIPGMAVSSIAIDPDDSDVIYISTGSDERANMTYGIGVLKSTDGGDTWNNTYLAGENVNEIRINVVKISPDDHNVIYAIGTEKISGIWQKVIYELSNGGNSLEFGTTYNNDDNVTFRDMEFNKNDAHIIYTSTDICQDMSGGVFFSGNNGSTWAAVNTGLSNHNVQSIAISGTNIFAGTNGGGVFLSSNNGNNWAAINTGLSNYNVQSIAINGTNIFAGTNGGGVFFSNNNGSTWTAVNSGLTNTDVRSIAISGSNIFAGTNGDGVFFSNNNGSTWAAVNTGLTNTNIKVLSISGTNIFAGTASGLFMTSNNGSNWTSIGLTNKCIKTIAITGINIFAGTATGLFLSTNNGGSWTMAGNGISTLDIQSLVISGSNIYAGTNGGGIFLSSNNGSNWTPVNTNLTCHNILALALSGTNIFAGIFTGARFLVSENEGTTWTDRTPELGAERIGIAVTAANPDVVYVLYNKQGSSNYSIKKSKNNGVTWDDVNSSIPNTGFVEVGYWCLQFDISPIDTSDIYVGGTTIYKSTDGGITFSPITQYWPWDPPQQTHADIRAISIIDNISGNDWLLIGHDGGISLSNNSGSSWNKINGNDLAITQFYGFDDFQNNEHVIGGTQDNGTLTNVSGTWIQSGGNAGRRGDGGYTVVDNLNPSTVYGICNSNITKSNDFGNNFDYIGNPELNWYLGMPIYLNPIDHTKLWFGQKHLWCHDGTSWGDPKWTNLDATNPNANVTEISAIAIAPSNPQIMYLAYRYPTCGTTLIYKFYKSINGGLSFTDISANLGAYNWASVTDIVVDPKDPEHLFASFNGYWPDGNNAGIYRVLESVNGGTTFEDMSTGLTPFPVNCLNYQEGTDDVIFAGTDVGVYRWNKNHSTWQCYNQELPVCIVTHIELNYCTSKIKISTYGRGIWESDLMPVNEYHITQNQTLLGGSYHSFNNDVIVDPGIILTIKGTVSIAPGKRLIVMPNAELIIDGGTITNGCGEMWQGIEVQGNNTSNQYHHLVGSNWVWDQGRFQIINGGTIENAVCGIKTINADASASGGIIIADDATFRNCQTAIEFMPYSNSHPTYSDMVLPNISKISNCIFETDNTDNPDITPYSFIRLDGVNGLSIKGCTFRNLTPTTDPEHNGTGIVSINSGFNLIHLCLSQMLPCPEGDIQKNTFNGLSYGVWASSSQLPINIINNEFENNFCDIFAAGVSNAKITNNNFDVGTYGLILLNSTAYQVEENTFSSDATNVNYGIGILNSGIHPNLIYKNKFEDNLSVACHAQGKNNGPITMGHANPGYMGAGLAFKCNEYNGTNQYCDIEITTGGISAGGIAGNQGSCISPVGNTFNNPSGLNTQPKNIVVNPGVAPFSYYCINDANNIPGVFQPNPPIVSVYPCGTSNSCPASNSNFDPHQLISDIGLFTTRLTPMVATIIKGNNQGLLTKVITANTVSGISFAALRDTLLNVSPYLSDTILIAAIEKYDTLEPVMLKDVMVANSPLTFKVKTVLDTKALPALIIQAIDSVQIGTSARAELEVQISDTMMLMGLAENNLIRQYMNDTTISGVDSVISYFLTRTDDISRKNLVQAYYTKGDSTNLIPALDSLRLRTYEDTLFKDFYSLMAEFCTNKKSLYQIDSMQELTIRNIAATNTEAAIHAQAVLAMVYNEFPPIELEKLNIPDSLSIHGYLKSDSLCNGLPAPGDTLMLLDADTNKVAGVLTVTDSAGYFVFYLPELLKLSDTALYGFADTDGTPVKNFELKTIDQWIAASPLNLTLRKTEADFIHDTILCYSDSVHFTSIVTGGMKPYTYLWDFGNDSVASSQNPTIFYDTTGTYLVTLSVSSSDGCNDTVRMSITINSSPIAVISPTSSTICALDSTTLNASGGVTYLWNTADTSAAITVAPQTSYTYTVTVTNAAGCKDTASSAFIVNPLPTVNITVSNSAICSGGITTLTADGGVIFSWNTSDTTAAITVAPDTTTTYSVTATSAAGCSYTASEIVTVNPIPIITLTPVISSICVGNRDTLTASGGASYLWNTAETTDAIVVVPDTTTTYTVTVTSAEGCIESENRTVTVNILPTATITPATTSICAGDSTTLTASGGSTYLWNTADTAAAITVVPDSTTTYTVTVTSAEGCNASDTATVTIDCANIIGRTMYAGKANVNTAPNPPTYNSRNYDINKEIVILKNQSGTEIARDTSDANGAFSFTDVDNGTYTLFYDKYTADTMQWCNDVNAADLSMILYLIASDTTTDPSRSFSRIYKKAANVDNNSSINSIDKARIQAKIGAPGDPTKNFPKGNWVNLDTTVTVNGSNLNFTIPVISYGDYNASSSKYRDSANTWSQVKSLTDENIITISDESLILNNSGLIEIPLRISSSLNDFAAMGLELYYPKEKFKLVNASMPNTSDSNGVFKINPTLQEIIDQDNDLLVTDDNGIIRVVFATTNFFDVTNNDIMINLGFQPLHELEPGEIEFKLFGTGMIADQYGTEAKANEYLLIPKIFVQGNRSEAGFDFTGYPNPFNGSTTLTYNLPENGTVKLRVYNALGVCVAELVNETQLSGKHTFVFSPKNHPAGMYTFRLDFTGEQDSNCAVLKMIYYK